MKEIKLTLGKVALVDDADYDLLKQAKWSAYKSGRTYYAQTTTRVNGKRTTLAMHRVIMETPKHTKVDHRDHNGLNNQRHNLTNCTHSQNQMNKSPTGHTKYKGVSYHNGYIRAKIGVNGKTIQIGHFKTEEEAAHAYDEAAIKYHGEFAYLNFKP